MDHGIQMSAAQEDRSYLDSLAQSFLDGQDPLSLLDGSDLLASDIGMPAIGEAPPVPVQYQFTPAQLGRSGDFIGVPYPASAAASAMPVNAAAPVTDLRAETWPAQAPPLTAAALASSSVQLERRGSPQRTSSPGRRRSSDSADGNLTAVSQLEKIKETNRKAQRRYRDRQREKLAAAEAQVAELNAKLSQLQMEKDSITASHEMLERYTSMQRQQSGGGTFSITQQGPEWWMDESTRQRIAALSDTDNMTFTVWSKSPMHLTRQQVLELPLEEVSALWRAYLAAFQRLLQQMRGDANSPAGHRLARLYFETLQMWGTLLTSAPDHASKVLKTILADEGRDSLHHHEHEPEDRRLATLANFSEEQKAALTSLREALCINLGRLQRRRENLSHILQEELPRPSPPPGAKPPVRDDRYGRTLRAMDDLRATLRDEHCCFLQTGFLFWRQIVTPAQGSLLNIESYPHDVRVLAVANCIAADAGRPSGEQLISRGAAEPDEELLSLEDALPEHMRTHTVPPVDAGITGLGNGRLPAGLLTRISPQPGSLQRGSPHFASLHMASPEAEPAGSGGGGAGSAVTRHHTQSSTSSGSSRV